MAGDKLIQWPIERASARGGARQDVWSLSLADGAVDARREGRKRRRGELKGPGHLERFGPAIDAEGRLWPPAFRFNPATGEALRPALEPLAPSGGRFGSAAGLPTIEGAGLRLDPAGKRVEPLEQGAFYFAQGGTPGFLYAADLGHGAVFRRSRLEDRWINHGPYPKSSLPPWAGGLAATTDAVLYSGETELVRLNEDPEDDGAETYPFGPLISAPAALPAGIVAPYRTQVGAAIAWMPRAGVSRRVETLMMAEIGEGFLAAPAVSGAGVAFWWGEGGFLSFEVGADGAAAVWRAWPEGFAAKPHIRPWRDPNGVLWAFGAVGDRAAVCQMTATGGGRQLRELDGPHVSAGRRTYRGLARYDRPWSEPVEQISPGLDMLDRWILPIAAFDSGEAVVALVSGAAEMRAFLFRERELAPRMATLFLHRPNAGLQPMGHTFDLSSTDQLDVFAAQGRLHLYVRDANECVSWPLV